MHIQEMILEIKDTLNNVFANVDAWFDKPFEIRTYRPLHQGWTVNEIVEHISLTNYFLLKLIDKGVLKALKNVNQIDLDQALINYSFKREKLDEIGIYQSFAWIRPEHMEPTGKIPLSEVRQTIREQKNRCLQHLDNMPDGEGVLSQTTMTVNNLGKLNVYEYIYFLAKHAQRHITQMEKNETEFIQSTH